MITRSRFVYSIITICTVVFMAFLSFSQINRDSTTNARFDVYDEGAHFDYVLKLKENKIPSWGSQYDQLTVKIVDCLGTAFAAPGNCGDANRTVTNYAPYGYNYEAQQPPLGYLPYVFYNFSPKSESKAILLGMRAFGSDFWLGLTSILLILVFLIRRVNLGWLAIATFFVLLNPTFIHALATINNDAAVVPAVLIWLLSELYLGAPGRNRGKLDWVIRVGVAILLGGVKGLLVLIPICNFLVHGIMKLFRGQKPRFVFANIRGAFSLREALPSVAAASTYVGFLVFQKITELVPSSIVLNKLLGFSKTSHVRITTIADSMSNLLSSQRGYYLGIQIDSSLGYLFSLAFVVLFAIRAYLDFSAEKFDRLGALSLTSWALIASLAVAWPIVCFVEGGYDFSTPPRYALMALPIISYCFTSFNSNKIRLSPFKSTS